MSHLLYANKFGLKFNFDNKLGCEIEGTTEDL